MWSNLLNKPKQGGPFKKDQAMLMGVPEEYDDNVEYRRTQQELLPTEGKENLDANRASKKPMPSSRSVLGEVENSENIPEVLKQSSTAGNSRNREPKLYRQYVQYDNKKGEAMLYVRMSKALHGMLKSALWFYKKLKVDLEA